MNTRRRLAATAALVAASALTLAGCASPGTPAETPTDNSLEVWLFSSSMPAVIEDQFQAAYPDYDVEVVEIPIGDMTQRLVVALQGGEGLPDVVQLPLRESGGLLSTGQFLDLTAELGPMADDFPDGALLGTGDQINTFTMGSGNMGLWVNEAALAKHGLAVPENPTWDDIVAVAEQLKEASGGTQYMFIQPPGANGANMFNAFFNSRGGTWWDENGELAVDEDLAADTLEFLVDLHERGLVYDGVWTEPTFWDSIRSEQVVGWTMNYGVGSTNLQKNVPEQSGQWRLITWPTWEAGDEQATGVFGGSLFAGLAASDNPQGVKDFILWWLTPEGLQATVDTLGLVSYEPAAEEIDLDFEDPYFGGQTVISDLSSVPYPPFYFFNWPETEGAVTAAVDAAYAGTLTPREAIDQIVAELGSL
ncbi:extracellular solute-binding protein [Herbiconiux moechotypicola]|uniref:Sugar ABC transporter substrate-binding protein n=1 Tax=Herbiconiux moechotypicola TaxID=637393 RepID=A0ABP5R4Y3_9MICO|nr:extracellular solute-binding protein [Herbiconiux moechotypicola]MCS5731898.1 extracellular solute-binding protein [Herbiconiux moechotypicola]